MVKNEEEMVKTNSECKNVKLIFNIFKMLLYLYFNSSELKG